MNAYIRFSLVIRSSHISDGCMKKYFLQLSQRKFYWFSQNCKYFVKYSLLNVALNSQ